MPMKIFDVRAYSQAYKDYATSSNMELPNANIVIVLERLPIKCRKWIRVCFGLLYCALWLVGKFRAILSTNEMPNQY